MFFIALIGCLVYFYFLGDMIADPNIHWILKYAFPVLFIGIPTVSSIVIYFNYRSVNRDMALFLDDDNLKYRIESPTKSFEFSFNDIVSANLVTGYRLLFNLGYLKLEIKGQDNYIYITTLLFDIENIPFPPQSHLRDPLPLIFGEDLIENKIRREREIENRIENFKKLYEKKSKEELKQMLSNKSKYQTEAIIVVKELIKKKTTAHNKL